MMLNKTTLGVDGFYLYAQAHKQVLKHPIIITFEDISQPWDHEWAVTTPSEIDIAFFIIITFLEFEVTGVMWEGV